MSGHVVHTVADLVRDSRLNGGTRAVVMTMGALHDGHAELVRAARARVGSDGRVIVTVFVNPTQFGPGEDFTRYPRTLDEDVALAVAAGADVVFAPDAVEVYGAAEGFTDMSVTVDPGPMGDILEGAARPGHFRGVLTVVAKLLGMTRPDLAFFGEKDYQQLTLVTGMVRDLSMPVAVVGVPTVREADGFARSSRNRYLTAEERHSAQAIPRCLAAMADAASAGSDAALAAGRSVLAAEPLIDVDYLVLTAPDLGPVPAGGPARALVAVRIGSTRLIDNRAMVVGT